MRMILNEKLIVAYKENGKNPNYSLSFLLNSLDPSTCTAGVELLDAFTIGGPTAEYEVDDKNFRIIQKIFGKVDAAIVERLLWIAFLLPDM